MITKININRKGLIFAVRLFLIPIFALGSFLFFSHNTNEEKGKPAIVSAEKAQINENGAIAQEKLCPAGKTDDGYLYVGCNGFF